MKVWKDAGRIISVLDASKYASGQDIIEPLSGKVVNINDANIKEEKEMNLDPKDGWYSQDFTVQQKNVGLMDVGLMRYSNSECDSRIRICRAAEGFTSAKRLFEGSLAELIAVLEAYNA